MLIGGISHVVMAHTYKHQLKYKSKQIYKLCTHPWPYSYRCNKDCIAYQFPWYKVPRDRDKQFWRTALWRSFRQKTKRKMYREDYSNLPVRPERYAWIID